ncbi:hypothetical protein FB45DRAFT_1019057 [Roridomyces roridus]|uniref:Uncharacterized protein n=1 Tax=Roridomyces roridus TaxID=1738132 RepID=A0AAD7CE86_9AGAR|nr:hypothetical protein FB45DRAFT_1019057 [Roridomyces roridus]
MPYTHDGRFSAWIAIDGVELPEYGLQVTLDAKTITCWIPSEVGKARRLWSFLVVLALNSHSVQRFSVHWTNWTFAGHTRGDVKMDGVDCGGRLSLGFSDSDLPQSSFKDGVAEVQVLSNKVPCNTAPNLFALKVPDHERDRLGVTQQIMLAEPIHNTRQTYSSTARLGPDMVTFIFKYRPLHVLKTIGLVGDLRSKGRKREGKEEPAYELPPVLNEKPFNIPSPTDLTSPAKKASRTVKEEPAAGPSRGFGLVPLQDSHSYIPGEWPQWS